MGIDGSFEKAGSDVFLLTPKDVKSQMMRRGN